MAPIASCQPRPPAPWAGVREATAHRTQAPQSRLGFPTRAELTDLWGPPDASPESEDCLALNVWTLEADAAAGRPVMVWFHGGAFAFGSSNQIRLQGSRLCRRGGVVVVTVNQRLNIFGHLDLSEIGGAEFARSGNAGTLDMVAALEWVRDNIAGFGGDPGNVTIFGESGGGAKVSTLMAMPMARGLFHKAIVQSGAAVRLRERDRATRLTEAVLAALGIDRTELPRLRQVPTARLLAAIEPAQRAVGPSPWPLFDRYPFGPTIDGAVLPRHPFHPAAPAASADIPLIIGDTRDEMASFLAHDDAVWHRRLTEAEMVARVRGAAGPHTEHVVETYRRLMPSANPSERLIATLTDFEFPPALANGGRTQGAAGRGAGLDVLLRLANAGVRWPARRAARPGRAVHLRHDRPDQGDRWECDGAPSRGHHVGDLGELRADRAPRPRRVAGLARLYPRSARDHGARRALPDRGRPCRRDATPLAGDRDGRVNTPARGGGLRRPPSFREQRQQPLGARRAPAPLGDEPAHQS